MALTVEIVVVPSSGMQKWSFDKRARIKCYLKSAPEKGKANQELIKFLAHTLACPQAALEIIRGATHRNKVVKIDLALTHEALHQKLGIAPEKQHAIF